MEDMGGNVSFMEDPGDVGFIEDLRMLASWRIWGRDVGFVEDLRMLASWRIRETLASRRI